LNSKAGVKYEARYLINIVQCASQRNSREKAVPSRRLPAHPRTGAVQCCELSTQTLTRSTESTSSHSQQPGSADLCDRTHTANHAIRGLALSFLLPLSTTCIPLSGDRSDVLATMRVRPTRFGGLGVEGTAGMSLLHLLYLNSQFIPALDLLERT
jgi:hypothetical protein